MQFSLQAQENNGANRDSYAGGSISQSRLETAFRAHRRSLSLGHANVFSAPIERGAQFYSQRLKKPHNILKYSDFQESKIDVLARWISVPGWSPAGAKNAQDEYTVIIIITRFYVHQDKKRLPITRYDKKCITHRYNMLLGFRGSFPWACFRDAARWQRLA